MCRLKEVIVLINRFPDGELRSITLKAREVRSFEYFELSKTEVKTLDLSEDLETQIKDLANKVEEEIEKDLKFLERVIKLSEKYFEEVDIEVT